MPWEQGESISFVERHRESSVEFISNKEVVELSNSGVTSRQLIFSENSRSERVTVTHATVNVGAVNPVHSHPSSEQIWIVVAGSGELILAEEQRLQISEGDVVRFEDGEQHGFENTGDAPFSYISVTSPPTNFRGFYDKECP